jgi:hypothetical protein
MLNQPYAMTRIFYLAKFLLFINISFGQTKIDLKEIEKLTKDSTSAYFYSTLISEFNNHPKVFESAKAKFIYYGRLYTNSYKMLQFTADDKQFNNLLSKGKYKKAIPFGERILQEIPANIEIISKLHLCYDKSDMKEEADTALTKLTILLNTVLESGTGQNPNEAFKVVAIGDEYSIMALLGLSGITRQSLMKSTSTIDSWKVKEIKSGKKSELHFEWLVNIEQGTKNMKWPD